MQDKYHVEIRISRDPAEPNLVTVAGKDEDSVYDCVDYLKEDEEAFLEQLAERVCLLQENISAFIRETLGI